MSEEAKIKREKNIGLKYGKLTILGFSFNDKRHRFYAICLCDCGNETIVDFYKLKTGHTSSCGCLIIDTLIRRNKEVLSVHNLSHHPMYSIWKNQMKRCLDKKNKDYVNYGGRGIKCIWTLREACKWYDQNNKPKPNDTLDRINNDGHYEQNNVRWASMYVQNINKRNIMHSSNVYINKNNKYRAVIKIKKKQICKIFNSFNSANMWVEEMKAKRKELYFND